jgi:hypothetical protein
MSRALLSAVLASGLIGSAAGAAPIEIDWLPESRWESIFEWTGTGDVTAYTEPLFWMAPPPTPVDPFPSTVLIGSVPPPPTDDPIVSAGDGFLVRAARPTDFNVVQVWFHKTTPTTEVELLIDGAPFDWSELERDGETYDYAFARDVPVGPATLIDLRVTVDGPAGDRAQGVIVLSSETNGLFVIPLPAAAPLALLGFAALGAAAVRRGRASTG